MWKDPIVEEVRKIRMEMARECDFDFDKFSRYLYEIQSKSPRKPVEITSKAGQGEKTDFCEEK